MNSSGIKRGLATTAVSALAIAGLPLFASSASAAVGDDIVVASVGPARNGGDTGAVVVLKTKNITAANLKLIGTNLTSSANSPTQTVSIVGTPSLVADDATNPNGGLDGFDEITVRIATTTQTTGGTASFAIYEDEDPDGAGAGVPNNAVDAAEASEPVSITTAGAPASIQVSPTLQSAPVNTPSGAYTVTIKDASGNTTQLNTAESIALSKSNGAGTLSFTPDATISAADSPRGTDTFRAAGSAPDLYTIALTASGSPAVAGVTGSASLDVAGNVAAGIATADVNIVTGADTFTTFGNPGDLTPNTFEIRPDQNSVTVQVRNATPGEVVILNIGGTGITFGGETSTQARGTVAANGTATVSFNIDAASIQTGDTVTIGGSTASTLTGSFAAPRVTSVDADATNYVSAYKGTVSPTVSVKDQFGNPVTGVVVKYTLSGGANAGATSPRTAVDSNGQVTFNITDTKASASNNGADTITFEVFAGQFDGTALATDTGSRISYTATGQGADFLLTVDGQTPGGTAYNPVIQPLTDTVVGGAQGGNNDSTDETAALAIVGGTLNAKVTVSVDNGGVVLKNAADDTLAEGSSTESGEIGVDTFRIAGTKAGVVNVTVTSGGKTQTATVNVVPLSQSNPATLQGAADLVQAPNTARNIAVEGPDGAVSGDVVEFVVTITDAFGNPVRGFSPNNISTQLLGPAELEGNSGNSNAAGEITYTVELDQDAGRDISFQVTGSNPAGGFNDFGAAADRLLATSTTNDGQGLTASDNVASDEVAVVDLAELEAAVERAEADLAEAEANLADAQAALDVALAEVGVQQAEVDRLKERKAELRQKLNKAKDAGNRQKAKTTRKKLRNVKQQLNDAKDALVVAQAAAAGAQDVVTERQQAVTEAEEALAQAQADLEEAQN